MKYIQQLSTSLIIVLQVLKAVYRENFSLLTKESLYNLRPVKTLFLGLY